MNEREDYLDRLLRGVEESPEDMEEMDDDFLEEFNKSYSEDDENDFLQEFERSRNNLEADSSTDRDMDFDMGDIDHIVSNVKNGTLDDDSYGEMDFSGEEDAFGEEDVFGEVNTLGEADLPIEESLQGVSEEEPILDEIETGFDTEDQEFMINTMDESDTAAYGAEGMDDIIPEMGEDMELTSTEESSEGGEMPEDEMESMAMELVKEINDLGLENSEEGQETKGKGQEEELDDLLAEEEESGKGKKGKKDKKGKKNKKSDEKPGFFKRLSLALFGEDEEEVEEESGKKIPEIGEIENISDENIDILRELEGNKGKAAEDDAKAKKAKKKKEKAEKKAQKKKEKEEKKAQKAKEKAAKPKKEKKVKEPKVVEKTKPLPKKPVLLIMLVGISLVILINLVSTQVGYTMDVASAKEYYEQGDYVEAYTCFTQGAKVKAADEELYNKAKYTAYVQQQLRNYYMYQEQEMYAEALNALICGIGRYDKNVSDAVKAGAALEYDNMLMELEKLLSENYSMTVEEARTMYNIPEKEDYTYALYDVIDSLGLSEE